MLAWLPENFIQENSTHGKFQTRKISPRQNSTVENSTPKNFTQ